MSKPREWWIVPASWSNEEDVIFVAPQDGTIHVIEKSAYDAVVKERDALKTALNEIDWDVIPAHSGHKMRRRFAQIKKKLESDTEPGPQS